MRRRCRADRHRLRTAAGAEARCAGSSVPGAASGATALGLARPRTFRRKCCRAGVGRTPACDQINRTCSMGAPHGRHERAAASRGCSRAQENSAWRGGDHRAATPPHRAPAVQGPDCTVRGAGHGGWTGGLHAMAQRQQESSDHRRVGCQRRHERRTERSLERHLFWTTHREERPGLSGPRRHRKHEASRRRRLLVGPAKAGHYRKSIHQLANSRIRQLTNLPIYPLPTGTRRFEPAQQAPVAPTGIAQLVAPSAPG